MKFKLSCTARGLATIAAAVLISSGSAWASLDLVKDGASDYQISLPKHASPQLRACADTLGRYIREVSGATIPITTDVHEPARRIYLQSGLTRDSLVQVDGLGTDGFLIRTEGDDLYLSAETDYGVQNAVYTFLETYLGCRMYSPRVRVIPSRVSIRLPEISDRQVPPITFRMQNIHDSSYVAWHKLDTHDDFGLFVHTFHVLVPPDKYFTEHPEYYSLLRGVRTPDAQLCLTNSDVFRIVCDELRKLMKERPEARFWSVSQNDTYVPCECDACRAIDSVEGSPSGSILAFVNRVADEFPDMTISTLAYQYSRSAPRNLKPRPNVNIMLCSIECNRSEPLIDDASSASFVKDVEDWSRLTHNIFLWDYVIQFRNLVSPFPNLHVLQPNIQFFARSGITSVFEQGFGDFYGEFAELRLYLIAKLLWNPDIDIDSVMDDFLHGFYGDAAPFIRQYIDTMHSALAASGEGLDIYGYPTRTANGYLSVPMIETYNGIFDRAEASVSGNPELLSRVQTARLPLQFAMLEQAKIAAAADGGCFVTDASGNPVIRPEIESLLTAFVRQCKEADIPALWEYGTSPDDYYAATRAFFDSGTRSHLARGKAVTLASPASQKYHAGEKAALTDGMQGWDDYRMHWLGFEGEEMDAVIDLGAVLPIHSISTNFLQEINSWVFMPDSVMFFISEDGKNYQTVGMVSNSVPANQGGKVITPFAVDFAPQKARYVRVQTVSKKTCPTWHKGSGGLAWIFIDEVVVK